MQAHRVRPRYGRHAADAVAAALWIRQPPCATFHQVFRLLVESGDVQQRVTGAARRPWQRRVRASAPVTDTHVISHQITQAGRRPVSQPAGRPGSQAIRQAVWSCD